MNLFETLEELKAPIIIAAVLAGLYYSRKNTPHSDPINKLLRIGLYGVSIVLLLFALFFLFLGSWMRSEGHGLESYLPGLFTLLFAILFAVTGSFLGYDLYDSGPSYQSSSTSPSAPLNPIFARRQATPKFEAENELTAIECPGCGARMKVPKLGTRQKVTCNSCGLSGDIKV